jgi:hypothetical protein
MPGTRKRAPSTPKSPKRASKRSKTGKSKEKRSDLGGGMLQTSFRLEGESSVKQSMHKLTVWSAPPADTLQTAGPSCHVHFAADTLSAAPEVSSQPSAHGEGVQDVFSTPVQPLSQLS